MTIVYEPPIRCLHRNGVDLPSPADYPRGTIARCACGRPFRRLSDGSHAFWQFVSDRRVRRILKRANKQKGEV